MWFPPLLLHRGRKLQGEKKIEKRLLIGCLAQWIMGLGTLKTAWQRQTKDFAHVRSEQYSSLLIENRGMGESDKPLMRYSTSEMARDILEVLDHIGWTGKRELHVVGISMGGMIAQELVSRRDGRRGVSRDQRIYVNKVT